MEQPEDCQVRPRLDGMPRIRVVVACSSRKNLAAPLLLRAEALRSGNLGARAKTWISRLTRTQAESLPAKELYAGEHWHVVRSLDEVGLAAGLEVEVWVASAGYGLVRWDHRLKPYSATFTPSHPDCVVPNSPGSHDGKSRQWWRQLSGWQGPEPHLPRSIATLADRDPGAPLIVALSAPYLAAVRDDVIEARDRHPNNLVVISAGTRVVAGLGSSLLPADGRLQAHFGGTRRSLNARVVRWLIQNWPEHRLVPDRVILSLMALGASAGAFTRPARKPMTDSQVVEYIEQQLRDGPVSKTALQRRLRGSGNACEQSRFSVLFGTVRAAR